MILAVMLVICEDCLNGFASTTGYGCVQCSYPSNFNCTGECKPYYYDAWVRCFIYSGPFDTYEECLEHSPRG